MTRIQTQITSRDFKLPVRLRERILRKADKLAALNERISHCRAVVEIPHKHRRACRTYNVRLEARTQRGPVIIDREPGDSLDEAIEKAFDAAERRLEDRTRRMRRMTRRRRPSPRH